MRRLTIAALCAVWLLAGCGGQRQHPSHASTTHQSSQPSTTPQAPHASTTSPARRHRHHRARHRRQPDPGRLPQTARLPSVHTGAFHAEMADLWQGIAHGQLKPALPAFFPETAYAQVKAIGDPNADWQYRLVADYAQDIRAAHDLLGSRAAQARLLYVGVPPGYAHWVAPNACYNRVGYWETPNSRIVYRQPSGIRSFGIASLISWRGVWYVVHLGAVTRTASGGVVDDPSSGPGYAAPSSTC